MTDNTVLRRMITIPVTVILFLVVSVGLPLLVSGALLVDLVRGAVSGKPAILARLTVVLWLYLLGEIWALIALAGVGLLPRKHMVELTYRLQAAWAAWTLDSIRSAFGLTFRVEGLDAIPPAPILLLARHASLVDTMLPARYVTRAHGIRLRYVLKKELLLDPALDIGGNRLPNHFVDRSGAATEVTAIRALAEALNDSEGMMIYPEGTRYSDEKRARYIAPLVRNGGVIGEIASRYRRVLPPRPGGTLAVLDVSGADVVVLAHRGLEGFATVKDVVTGNLVGSRIDVRLWRVPHAVIPMERSQQIEWLYRLWAEIDAWVVESRFAE